MFMKTSLQEWDHFTEEMAYKMLSAAKDSSYLFHYPFSWHESQSFAK